MPSKSETLYTTVVHSVSTQPIILRVAKDETYGHTGNRVGGLLLFVVVKHNGDSWKQQRFASCSKPFDIQRRGLTAFQFQQSQAGKDYRRTDRDGDKRR